MTTEYDYTNQAWLIDGRYVACGHPKPCHECYGTVHEGETMSDSADKRKFFKTAQIKGSNVPGFLPGEFVSVRWLGEDPIEGSMFRVRCIHDCESDVSEFDLDRFVL